MAPKRKKSPSQNADSSPDNVRITWEGTSEELDRTDRLINYYEDNPNVRRQLFSDSSAEAKDQNRQKCRVTGATKDSIFCKVAGAIFLDDHNLTIRQMVQSGDLAHLKRLGQAVKNRTTQ